MLLPRFKHLIPSAIATAISLLSIAPTQAMPPPFEALPDVNYWTDLCRLQANATDYENALKACEQAIALEPKNADFWARHSGVLVSMEAFPDAIASANRALTFDPENSLAIAYQCVAYTALGENEIALDKCNDALRVNGNWGNENPALAWFYRGEILDQAQQYELALVAYERTLLLEPENSHVLTHQCQAYVVLERPQNALDACGLALSIDQNWGESSPAHARTYQGQAHTQLSEYNQAIFAYDQAIGLDPNNALTWAAQGQVLETLHRDQEALVSYDRAVAIKADYALALLGQCTLLNRLKSYEPALAACDAAIDGDSNWGNQSLANAWNERSVALAGTQQYEEALASINRAVGIQPDYLAAHNHRSTILWYLERYPEALAANQQALYLDDTYAPAWFTRGLIFRATGQYPHALAAYNQALALNPFNDWGWTNRSLVLWQLEQYGDALDSAERAIALNSESVQAWYNKGVALSALGEYEGAIATYDKVISLDATHVDALTGRGIAWFHLEDYAAATADLEAALALNPDNSLAQDTLTALAEAQPAESLSVPPPPPS
ncbi:MAG: tetratricopeptide repeat protein [Cyanobacteria bacterium P01_F01_bin.116]